MLVSRKHFQLQQLAGLVEASVETGKGQRKGKMLMQLMGSLVPLAIKARLAIPISKLRALCHVLAGVIMHRNLILLQLLPA